MINLRTQACTEWHHHLGQTSFAFFDSWLVGFVLKGTLHKEPLYTVADRKIPLSHCLDCIYPPHLLHLCFISFHWLHLRHASSTYFCHCSQSPSQFQLILSSLTSHCKVNCSQASASCASLNCLLLCYSKTLSLVYQWAKLTVNMHQIITVGSFKSFLLMQFSWLWVAYYHTPQSSPWPLAFFTHLLQLVF